MNKWFKKFPYTGWITIFVISLLGCTVAYFMEKHQYSEKSMAGHIQADFSKREATMLADHSSGLFEQFYKSSSRIRLSAGYFLFISKAGKVEGWNTSSIDLPESVVHHPDSFAQGQLMELGNGYYFIQSWPFPNSDTDRVYAYTIIPVFYNYAIENEYFQSHFVADKRIPISSYLTLKPEENSHVIRSREQRPAFYVNFQGATEESYIAGIIVWILLVITLGGFCFWIHELCYSISQKRKKFFRGWFALLGFVVCAEAILKNVTLPLGFSNSKLFSPELFSSGEEVRSLGNLIINVLLNTWSFVYLLTYTPLDRRRIFHSKQLDIVFKLAFMLLLIFVLIRDHAGNMYKLVIDSKISFEVGDFSHLNVFTFVGIFTLSLITVDFLIILGIISSLMKTISKRLVVKYLIVILFTGVAIYLVPETNLNVFYIAFVFMSIAGLLLIDALGLPLSKNKQQYKLSVTPKTYIWFAILCSWITLEIFYFNYAKEKELRKVFAQKQAQKDDALVAYTFSNFSEKLNKDTMVKSFFKNPSPEFYSRIEKYIRYNYLTEYTSRYNVSLYFYDKNRKSIYRPDTTDIALLHIADSLTSQRFTYGAMNMEQYSLNSSVFWFICGITGINANEDTLGYAGFNIAMDNRSKMVKQRSFFQKKYNPTDQQYFDKYLFGIYRNHRLWAQGGDHIFPYRSNTVLVSDYKFIESLHSSMLLYCASKDEQIKVIYNRNLLTDIVSLFSYVLAVLLVLTGLVFLLRQLLFYPGKIRLFFKNNNLTIRSKVNLTILVTVFASLLVVGVITLSFLNNRYKQSQRKNLQNLLFYYAQNILHFTDEHPIDFDNFRSGYLSKYSDLSYVLNVLAEEQGAEINVYNDKGILMATSQVELLQKGLMAQYMLPAALHTIESGEQSELITEEHIGTLKYQSIYAALRDKNDKVFAYINLPYYASSTELNDEISNVLVSLINVYTLVFFLSGICAILISNSIIRSFRLLIDQFRNIRLSRNEVIVWPYKDEISVLVKEYNAMMQKVEAMAAKLARTEREEAWREIAKQVAHEIKNPLTPMKLNIQYLQQAIKSGRPDIEDLASRVSLTLIEQIENLNLIASEFSNFAKMPQAHPEILDLNDALYSVVSLFQNDEHANVELLSGPRNASVYMDKSYFIRIFNNLIQNAVQSVPDERRAVVQLSYEQKNGKAVIAVRDNGSGIPEDMQANLFVPYFTTKSSGTGLGLPMTKNMVEHSNGSLWFDSVVGKGTIFYVCLPVSSNKEEM